MKQYFRCTRIFILSLLAVSVCIPIFILSHRLRSLHSAVSDESAQDLTNIKHRTEAQKLNAVEKEDSETLKERPLEVFKDGDFGSVVSSRTGAGNTSNDSRNVRTNPYIMEANGSVWKRKQIHQDIDKKNISYIPLPKEYSKTLKEPPPVVFKDDFDSVVSSRADARNTSYDSGNVRNSSYIMEGNGTIWERKQRYQDIDKKNISSVPLPKDQLQQRIGQQSQRRQVLDVKVNQIKDQLIQARVYLKLTQPNSNSQLVRELRLRTKELERAIGDSTKDSDLSRSALQRMRAMESTLVKASHEYTDCPAMVMKLHAFIDSAEEQIRAQQKQEKFLTKLSGRTTPKGLHCLSMRLTSEYFSIFPKKRRLPNQHKFHDPDLYHFAVFSDNVLACAVVVRSTISTSLEPEKIVFHIVTDSLNLPAMSMWFLLNRPGKAAMQIQSIESFNWLSTKYGLNPKKKNSQDPRYSSLLNHLRFYLPDIFPMLKKVLLLDHDVVVQKDLTPLWGVDMKGKVNGAVETCQEGENLFRRMDIFINFSDPLVAEKFDPKKCTWAFGMNIFDLEEWRIQNLTGVYRYYLQQGGTRPLWKEGSLPLGWVTFYNNTVGLDKAWHILGLGHNSGVRSQDIDRAAVIHYDGVMKPWLDSGLQKYKDYWKRFVNYQHPYLQQCNLHK